MQLAGAQTPPCNSALRPTDSAQMCPRYPRRGGPDLGGCLAPSCWGLARAHASSPPAGSLALSCILFLPLSLAFSFSLVLFPFLSSLPIPHFPSQIQTLFQWGSSFCFSQTFSLSQSLSLSLKHTHSPSSQVGAPVSDESHLWFRHT